MNYLRRMWVLAYILIISTTALLAANAYKITYEEPRTNEINLSYQLNDYSISEVIKKGKTYTKINFEGGILSHNKGYAAVPFISKSIKISNSKNMDLEISKSSFVDIQLKNEYLPSRGILYRNQDIDTIPYKTLHTGNSWYPKNVADASTPFIFRDIRGERITFNPFQYNPQTKTLRIYKNITVKLQPNNETPINPILKLNTKVSPVMNAMYSSIFENYNKVRFDHSIGELGSILVIYTSRDANAIMPYVEWKKEKGYVIYTQEVATGTNITSNVADFYASHNDLLYVQIVGDWADIKTPFSTAAYDPNLGCVVGNDKYPDLIIGRFSASNASEVTIQVNKTINYEKMEAGTASWLKTSLGVASDQGIGSGDDGEGDWEHQNVIYNDKLSSFTYDTKKTAYETDGANGNTVQAHINDGAGIINYTGHGSHAGWATPSYTTNYVNSLSNGEKLPFINSVACVIGEFYAGGDCFSEALQKKVNGGAVVNLGSTINQSWKPPMRGQDYFNDLLIGGYNYNAHSGQYGINTSEQRTTFGALALNSNILMCNEDYSGGQPMLETWTTFGDASLQVRTDNPSPLVLSNSDIIQGATFVTKITNSAGIVKGAMVALTQNGNTWSGVTDTNGNVSIDHDLAPGICTFVVTAFNAGTIYDTEKDVVSQTTPYVVVNSYSVVDGNNNQADFDETINLTTVIKNIGGATSNNINLMLSSESSAVSAIGDNTGNFSSLAFGNTATLAEEFQITFADDVEDQTNAEFVMTITDNSTKKTYVSNLNLIVNAPDLSIGDMIINDSNGNNDGFIDPGETAIIYFPVSNNGHVSTPTGTMKLTSPTNEITIANPLVNKIINAGESVNLEYTVTASSSMNPGDAINFNLNVTCGTYTASKDAETYISGTSIQEIDWFENFSSMDELWITSNNGCNDKWSLSASNNAGGNSPEIKLAWQGGPTTPPGVTKLITPALNTYGVANNDTITINFKHYYNYGSTGPEIKLQASNNGTTWTDIGWTKVPTGDLSESISVKLLTNIGSKTYFAWVLSGIMYDFDYWFIDDIAILGNHSGILYSSNTPENTKLYQNYPNPFNPITTISFFNKTFGEVNLSIYNAKGQLIKNLLNRNVKAGYNSIDFDASSFNSGIYFYMLQTVNSKIIKKMLLVK